MKFLFLFLAIHSVQLAVAQFRARPALTKYEFPKEVKPDHGSLSQFGLLSDQPQVYRYSSPAMSWLPGEAVHSTTSFWINSISSQSYNNGRFGTYYYWDIQGNLQGTRGFIDLSGGKKRGIKLVFPWR